MTTDAHQQTGQPRKGRTTRAAPAHVTRPAPASPGDDDQSAGDDQPTVERWRSPNRAARFMRTEFEPQGFTAHMALLVQLGRGLDDATRVLILALLAEAEGPLYGQALAEQLKLSPQTVSHHLHILRNSGLVRERREGAFRYYQLDGANIARIAEQAFGDDHLGLPTRAQERAALVATYFRDGRLVEIPARRATLRYVLDELARSFSFGRIYDEREVNALLKDFHDDTARLRRGLVDEQIMLRDGGRYWLVRPHDVGDAGASAGVPAE